MKTLFASLFVMGMTSSPILAEGLPPDVAKLKQQRDKHVNKIDEIYRVELKKLRDKYTKEANLEVAIQIEDLIKSIEVAPDPNNPKIPSTDKELEAFLLGSSWGGKNQALKDGLIFAVGTFNVKATGLNGKYVVSGPRTMTLMWNSHTSIKCEFSEDFSSFRELDGEFINWQFLGRVKKSK